MAPKRKGPQLLPTAAAAMWLVWEYWKRRNNDDTSPNGIISAVAVVAFWVIPPTRRYNNNNGKKQQVNRLDCTILFRSNRLQQTGLRNLCGSPSSSSLCATSSSDLKQNDKSGATNSSTSRKPSPPVPRSSTTTNSKKGTTTTATAPTTMKSAVVFPNDSVVSRLKQAAMRASAQIRQQEEKETALQQQQLEARMSDDPLSTRIRNLQNQQQSHTTAQGKKPLGSLTQLTAMIDAQLLMTGRSSASARGGTMQNSNTHGYDYYNLPQQLQQQRLPRDSMTALMTHNDRFETKIDFKTDAESISKPTGGYHQQQTTHHVAVVLAKPLVQDQITVEYASRIQRLARAIINDDYRPDTICFVQSYAKQSNADNADHGAIEGGGGAVPVVSDCDAGYTYFRHLAASTNLDLDDIVFHLERCSIQNGALDNIANMVKHKRLPVWINQSSAMLSTACSEYNSTAAFSRNRRHQQKLHVQLALVSSDYHLCILNDIHVRSPGQSPLRSFERWPSVESCTATEGSAPFPPSTVQIHTSWTFLYATTASMRFSPSLASSVPFPNDGENYCTFVSTFTSACYKRSQELIPVLQNLRGVVADKEFFQRDNYRVLVQTRRALVTDMERLYQQQPSLAAVHKVMTTCTSSSFASLSTPNNPETDENRHSENERKIPLDVVLEGALLSLGRCLDLVRPAGLLTGSVAARDFRLAVTVLEQAVSQISIACDPDQPFPSAAWGTSTNDNFSEEVSVL